VPDYRAYTIGHDGHIIGYEPLVCADDTDAIEKTSRLVDGHAMELWSGERLIVRLRQEPGNPMQSPAIGGWLRGK
jgi:hypothetical protein